MGNAALCDMTKSDSVRLFTIKLMTNHETSKLKILHFGEAGDKHTLGHIKQHKVQVILSLK